MLKPCCEHPKAKAGGLRLALCNLPQQIWHRPLAEACLEARGIGRGLAPLGRELRRHPQMELQPVRAPHCEGLLLIRIRACKLNGSFRQPICIAVPLQSQKLVWPHREASR